MTAMTTETEQSDGFFQVQTSTKQNPKIKRVYIGGLPKDTSQQGLVQWMTEYVPSLSVNEIEINPRGKATHALVDCGTHTNLVISKLHQQTFQGRKISVQREKRNTGQKKNTQQQQPGKPNKKQSFGGWSKPKQQKFTPIPMDEATEIIRDVISTEIQQSEGKGEDPINAAIAGTAAASLLASMNAFSDENDNDPLKKKHEETEGRQKNEKDSEFQMRGMSELLAEFGQADPNWKKQHVNITEEKEESTSRLAPKGKAPIHIILSSFGYLHGAPKRPEGWSHSQPLAAMDCREDFESVDKYLEWKTGLTGHVKRVLHQINDGIRQYARTNIANQVWDCLIQSQEEGYGYASPLEMTIYVGSEMGKHRSVVLCEWAATAIRKKLRANELNRIHQPVSVATYHRDVERQKMNNSSKPTQKKKHPFAGDW